MQCPQCGEEWPDRFRVCPVCAVSLHAELGEGASGAIAQQGGVAAGEGGVAVEGQVHGGVFTSGAHQEIHLHLSDVSGSTLLPTAGIPDNLPQLEEFIGREKDKKRVYEALHSRSWLICIDGIGGIGKTSLACAVVTECLEASKRAADDGDRPIFKGFIWTPTESQELTFDGLLNTVAQTLYHPGYVRLPLAEKQYYVRRLLQSDPYLLILDNFETVTDDALMSFLLNLPAPSKALLTSREQRLRQAWAVSIGGLEQWEALTLIRSESRRLGLMAMAEAQDDRLLRLCEATGGVPLAIKWAMGQIKQRGQSLDSVLAYLHQARGDIFHDMFSRSWSLLTQDARRVMMAMPLFAAPASREAIEAASDVHHFDLDDAIGQLVEMSLINATDERGLAQRRYSVHQLSRAYAAARFEQHPASRELAMQRLAEFYQRFSREHCETRYQGGFDRLQPELENALAVVEWCWKSGDARVGMDIYYDVSELLTIAGDWRRAIELGRRAIDVASEMGDQYNVARFLVWPEGWILRKQGDLHTSREMTTQALAIFEQIGNEEHAMRTKRNLGRIFQDCGDLEQAEQLLRETLTYYQSTGNRYAEYMVSADLADVMLKQSDLAAAWALCDDVIESARQFGDPERLSNLLEVMGQVAFQRGDIELARTLWEEDLRHSKRADRPDLIGGTLARLAQVAMETGQMEEAKKMLLESQDIYERLRMTDWVNRIERFLTEVNRYLNEGGSASAQECTQS